ncbi:MAG TPA: ATP-binding protein, partial [Anaerolineae bacterium]|nr:ATP-binding protein [Anaerolineae bacterium]
MPLFNRLWVRLTIAFAIVAVIGIGVAALLADQSVNREFRSFIERSEADLQNSALAEKLVDYYEEHHSWLGVNAIFTATLPFNLPNRQPGQTANQPPGQAPNQVPGQPPDRFNPRPSLIVADAEWHVVFDSSQRRLGERLSPSERDTATALQLRGQTIGYLLFTLGPIGNLTPPEQAFIDQVRRSLLLAALIASVLGILVGLAFSRNLTRPLDRLASAARAIAAKDLTQRVPPSGTIEVANVAHAFNDMASSLQKSEELRRNLVADVAHELRTPLSVMQGSLTAQLDGVFPLDLAETAKLYDETRLLSRLVDDLRELAQAEAGQLQLNLGVIDLQDVIARTADAFSGSASEKQVNLIVPPSGELPRVKADSERVMQVLRVLLTNALRHTEADGQVTLAARVASDQVEVSVQDTGEGIALDDLPYVFDRFWRGDKARARETGGSGLGLAIAKQLIEA